MQCSMDFTDHKQWAGRFRALSARRRSPRLYVAATVPHLIFPELSVPSAAAEHPATRSALPLVHASLRALSRALSRPPRRLRRARPSAGAHHPRMTILRPSPPQLRTLHLKPSWHNRAGRIDRSACIELHARSLWRCTTFPPIRAVPAIDAGRAFHDAITSCRAITLLRPRCIAVTQEVITVLGLLRIHNHRKPVRLAGDRRTRKSNVMKSRYADPPFIRASNPNAGATRLKILGLDPDSWQQTITIQRWAFPLPWTHRNFNKAFLIPHHGPGGTFTHIIHPCRFQHFLLCPACNAKVAKLFLPMCYEEEMYDAAAAQRWADLFADHPATRNKPMTPAEAAIITRYAPLFEPRRMTCRKCLHLRYGEARGRSWHEF